MQELGEDAVQQFRTGFLGRPPPMQPDHPHWHGREKKYSDLNPDELPTSESLQDTMARTEGMYICCVLGRQGMGFFSYVLSVICMYVCMY